MLTTNNDGSGICFTGDCDVADVFGQIRKFLKRPHACVAERIQIAVCLVFVELCIVEHNMQIGHAEGDESLNLLQIGAGNSQQELRYGQPKHEH